MGKDIKESKDFYPLSNWGLSLINKLIHPFTVVLTPVFTLILIVYFVIKAFQTDLYSGIRSFAGTLLPLVMVTFIFIFHSHLIGSVLGKISVPISAGFSFVLGIIVMIIVRTFSSSHSAVPAAEILLSGSFSLLVFSYIHISEKKILAYYYGMVCGFLTYIIFFGFPIAI